MNTPEIGASLLKTFATVPDPRAARGRRHPLVRRSSNTVEILTFEVAPGLGRPAPEEGRGPPIPVADASVGGAVDVVRAGAVALGERSLAQDLSEALNEIEPSGGLGQRHEVEAGMATVPQHGVDAPVQREVVYDELGIARRGKALQTI